ncbi:bifunctional metallophosphatase/5'-nucleotidase [Paenibacillus humicola]|uniref:bifunctional metallophosphatase/5'-nucleotidase n=1 Tax=Paenibacillus humicola TaxID=3110540 RepID=UPI00237BACC6|nr:bifunctional UDP-sugar hydrolase/5'-nucleotidase [Paenibacillus humicola]
MNQTSSTAPELILLHSNDIHSRLEQAAKIAAYIAETRRAYGAERVLALDIGDHMDRMRVETEGSDGLANIALLNAAGYEAVTLGNNEGLTMVPEQLAEAYGASADFQVVCANMQELGSGKRPDWLKAHAVIRKGRLNIGLIGATAAFADFYSLLGWEASDPIAAVREEAERLRDKVDVLVVLSHLGLPMDRRMAREVPGLDLILGGHTHHLLESPEIVNGTCICAAGKFGEYVGRVEIGIDPVSARPVFRCTCVPMAAYAEQPEAAEINRGFREAGMRRLSRVVARLEAPLPASAERESPLGNLLAAGLRRWTDAEIGIVNAGQLLGGLAAGDVTEGDIHALCPSPINPCRMLLSGTAIRRALEEALLGEYIGMAIRGFGFRGLQLGTLAVDGLVVHWNPDGPPYAKIGSVQVCGAELEPERTYSVGTIDMFTFGVGYETMKSGADIRFYLPEFIRDVLARELKDEGAIEDCSRRRWIAEGPSGSGPVPQAE